MDTGQSARESSATPWDFFDRIYCISVTQRTDRRQNAQREFARVGLAGRVQFFLVEKHPTNSEQGIFESHLACLRSALEAGGQRILIFEDDVEFPRFSSTVLARSIEFLRVDANWHIFFLGCFVRSSRKTKFPSVLRVRFRCAAHAYILNREFALTLLSHSWSGIAFDDLLRDLNDDALYACYPALAFQSNSPSDNSKMESLDRTRRWLGGLARLQRWNEFIHHRAVEVILAHVAVVLLLIFLILSRVHR